MDWIVPLLSCLKANLLSGSRRRTDRGLTTLEWLLIVAAVAGLAALAVVLVQNVVDETAEEIAGSNARVTAARVAAARITSDAANEVVSQADPDNDKMANDAFPTERINADHKSKCDRLNITYSDVSLQAEWTNSLPIVMSDQNMDTWRSGNMAACNIPE